MDPLLQSDLELEKELSPAEKLAQALEVMSLGLRLKRHLLRTENPEADEGELDRLYLAWLLEPDG